MPVDDSEGKFVRFATKPPHQRVNLFVYGTLMRGEVNHHMIEGAAFRGEKKTVPGFTLYDLGGFPGMVKHGNGQVTGEVYNLGTLTMNQLDLLESAYVRAYIRTEDGKNVQAYLLRLTQVLGRRIITSGNWKERRQGNESNDRAI